MELHGGGGGESWWRLVFARDRAAPRGDSISASYNAHLVATVARSTVRIFQPGYLHPQVAEGTWKKLSKISCGRLKSIMKFQTNQINWSDIPSSSPLTDICNIVECSENWTEIQKIALQVSQTHRSNQISGKFPYLNCVNIRTHSLRTKILVTKRAKKKIYPNYHNQFNNRSINALNGVCSVNIVGFIQLY